MKLERLGHRVTVAGSGKEALEDTRKRRAFDIIFMDFHMPEMDGLAATAKIREHGSGNQPRTPIVADDDAVKAVFELPHASICFEAESSTLQKPIEDRELYHRDCSRLVPIAGQPGKSLPDLKPAPCEVQSS